LAPCVIGYAEIGTSLAERLGPSLADNRFRAWIDSYAGEEYQALASAQVAQLDRLMAARGGPGRFAGLVEVFRQAVRLETDFWEMGLTLAH
jgi:thiaminase/transcriptional activator TenA